MVLLILLYSAVVFCIVYLLRNALRPGLVAIPGPFLAKFSNGWRLFHAFENRFVDELEVVHKKHGKLVRIGPNVISTTDVRSIDGLLGVRSDLLKSDQVKGSQPLFHGQEVPTVFTTRDRRLHGAIRRPIANAFATSAVLSYEPFIQDTIRFFLKQLDERFIVPGNICRIDQWVQYFAFDVVSSMTMSRPLGFLEKGEDVDGILQALGDELTYRGLAGHMPLIDDIMRRNPIVRWLKPTQTSHFAARANKVLQDRLAEDKEAAPDVDGEKQAGKTDFTSRFLAAKEKNPGFLTDRHLIGYVQSNLVAGSDTTAIVLRTALYRAMKNPAITTRLREELDAAHVSYPLHYNTATQLPYCSALIKESLRHHFVGAALIEREVPAQGFDLPDGTRLPAGTVIGISPQIIMRDREVYGADADEFKPERWLQKADESEEKFKERLHKMRAADLSFSQGSRGCLGKHIAELEIYKIVPTLLGLIDLKLVHPEREWTITNDLMQKQSDMDVVMQWREGKSLKDLDA